MRNRNAPVVSHLTVNGTPWCNCPDQSNDVTVDGVVRSLGAHITCGQPSINAAHRAKKFLQRHVAGVRVTIGPCPVGYS